MKLPSALRPCPGAMTVLLLIVGLVLSGCSLIDKKSRPDPNQNHVNCQLEYRPSAGGSGPDLLFLATSYPYNGEAFNLSLPDVLLHQVAAPGRHLIRPAVVEGATCSTPPWPKGHRLPARVLARKTLVCWRHDLDEVVFEVATKWGECRKTIPQGDATPRDLGRMREFVKLPPLGSAGTEGTEGARAQR